MLLPIETIKILQNHPDQSFKAGEVVFEAGQTGNVMYGVIEGERGDEKLLGAFSLFKRYRNPIGISMIDYLYECCRSSIT